MTIYAHINTKRDVDGEYTQEFSFVPLDALPRAQRALWDQKNLGALEDWIAPLGTTGIDTAITVYLNPAQPEMVLTSAFVQNAGAEIRQPIRPQAGYLARRFNISAGADRLSSSLLNARTSPIAARNGFIPLTMHAFQAIDVQRRIETVSMSATNVGGYVWLTYGGIRVDLASFSDKLRKRWGNFCKAANLIDAPYDRELEKWVRAIQENMPSTRFRAPFAPDAAPLTRHTAKTLILGDLGCLVRPQHRYHPYARSIGAKYAFDAAMEGHIHFHPLNADFQRHFAARVDASLAMRGPQ